MAIDKINTGALGDNLELPGTEAAKMPNGTTAQRANVAQGDIRFNSTTSLMEYYDGVQWKSIDAPPLVSSISPTTESDPNANITISGTNFFTGATVKFVGNDGTEYSSPSVTRNSPTQIVATTPATALSVANEPYDVVVTNVSGLFGTLEDALDAGGVPAFNESAGSLGTVYDSARTGLSFDAGAVDPDGDTITYSLASGDSLPSGLSLNSSTGEISGDADAVGSDTTTTFTIEAATNSDTSTREFSITVAAPVVQEFTTVTSGTFSVPTGITSVNVLVVAGGGGGGGSGTDSTTGGGGGAGGLIYRPAFPVTPGGSVSYTVGGGASRYTNPQSGLYWAGQTGQDSTFGSLTAKGGGGGGSYAGMTGPGAPSANGFDGGSGGGGSTNNSGGTGGTGTQPQQPGDSGDAQYGFGNPGGNGAPYANPASPNSGGGGGAGGTGNPGDAGPITSQGGIGKQYDISGSQVYYAGGGNGGGDSASAVSVQGGGGVGAIGPVAGQGSDAQANRGGGGGGASTPMVNPDHSGGAGGSGIVIVKY